MVDDHEPSRGRRKEDEDEGWGRTDGDSVDHDGDLSETPAHDEGTDGELLLERCAEDEEAAKVERHGDVACPIQRTRRDD